MQGVWPKHMSCLAKTYELFGRAPEIAHTVWLSIKISGEHQSRYRQKIARSDLETIRKNYRCRFRISGSLTTLEALSTLDIT